ncbi:MAG: hypothetical protein LBU15_03995 [Rickettsiales bacterium]|jgi:hypothetical protein|nr:hypothetical protein [Rickettsiales bacterium]
MRGSNPGNFNVFGSRPARSLFFYLALATDQVLSASSGQSPVPTPGNGTVEVHGNFECGYSDNRALYATFGYERQLCSCSQVVLGLEGRRPGPSADGPGGQLVFKIEFAPLYNSIETVDRKNDGTATLDDADIRRYRSRGLAIPSDGTVSRLTYELVRSPLGNGKTLEVDGSSEYVNWYKNQGSRLYHLGGHPLREMYLGWISEDGRHRVLFGRMKNLLSFDERSMAWREDAWFAPMSYWISREIYSGISYSLGPGYGFVLNVAIFSGDANPTKQGVYYLDNSGGPNKKTNNTPTLEFNLKNTVRFGSTDLGLFLGLEKGSIGSTWNSTLGGGKHNRKILAAGFDMQHHLSTGQMLDSVRIFFQYTRFTSGLAEKSSQNTGHPAFRDIVQRGFFAGVDLAVGPSRAFDGIEIGLAYELFDRYDYRAHIYSVGRVGEEEGREGPNCLGDYRDSRQHSFLVNLKFLVNENIQLNLGMHFLRDPLYWISDVLGSRGSSRYKLSLAVVF